MFEVFNSPQTIQKIVLTPETTNQTTGEIVPAAESSPEIIFGHISDMTQKELFYLDPALVEQGVRKFATSENVSVGDQLKITELDSNITYWKIEQLIYESNLMQKYVGELRKAYLIKRI